MISAVWFRHRMYSVHGLEKDVQRKVSSVVGVWRGFPAATAEARSLIECSQILVDVNTAL